MLEPLLKYGAWPGVVLAGALVAMIVFKQPITRLIDRIRKLSREGLETGVPSQAGPPEKKQSSADEFLKIFDNALMLQREAAIGQHLDASNVPAGPEREKVLLRLLAASSIIQAFERTNILIWGSQIAVLQFLNSTGPTGVRAELLRPSYDAASTREPQLYMNYGFDQWLAFLEANSLLKRSGEYVTITLEGREFLKYLVHQGYPLYRGG